MAVQNSFLKREAGLCRFCLMAFLGITLLFGCTGADSGKEVVEFWAMGVEGEQVKQLLPEFERGHPDIQVRVQSIPWSAAHEKLITAYAGDATPDLCQLGNTWIPEFEALNAIQPLDSLLHTSGTIDSSDYFQGIWETNRLNGRVYGIPWYVDTRVLFYRKDLLKEAGFSGPPTSWDELYEACELLVRRGVSRYGLLIPLNDWRYPIIFGLQNGARLLTNGGRYGNFSAPAFQQAFRYFLRHFQDELSPLGMTEISNIYHGFTEGYYAMIITGPWNIGEFSRRLPADMAGRWGTAPLPGPGEGYPGVSVAGGSSLVIFRSSEKKAAAWKVIQYLSQRDVQMRFYQETGDLPANQHSWQDSSLAQNPYVQAFYIQLQHVVPTPKVPEWEQIMYKVQQYAEQAAYGRTKPEQALQRLDREVDNILEKRRWLLKRE